MPVLDRDYFLKLVPTPRPMYDAWQLQWAAEYLPRQENPADPAREEETIAWMAVESDANHTKTGKDPVKVRATVEAWMATGLPLGRVLDWRDRLNTKTLPDERVRALVVEYENAGVSPKDLDPIDAAWTRAGIPVEDRDAWTAHLTKYPYRSVFAPGHVLSGTSEAMSEAEAAVERGDIPNTDNARATYAWEHAKAQGTYRRGVQTSDIDEVAAYARVGGTLTEAQGYQSAFEAWVALEGSSWSRNIPYVAFDGPRLRKLRAQKVTPELLAEWVAAGNDPRDTGDVGALAKWARRVCRDASARHVLIYKAVAKDDAEVRGWEKQRKAGEDVLPELEFLHALSGPLG